MLKNKKSNIKNVNRSSSRRVIKMPNECKCVWQGTVPKRNFQAFLLKKCETESELRSFLQVRGVVSYWDNYNV